VQRVGVGEVAVVQVDALAQFGVLAQVIDPLPVERRRTADQA
jgi:hypothetical protein